MLLALGFAALFYMMVQLVRIKIAVRAAQRNLPVVTRSVAHAAAVMTITALFEEGEETFVPIGAIKKQDAATLMQYLADHWEKLDRPDIEALRKSMPRA